MRSFALGTLVASIVIACAGEAPDRGTEPLGTARAGERSDETPGGAERDTQGDACRARMEALLAAPDLPGIPAFDAARIEILGRARGEPMVFVREPQALLAADLPERLRASQRAFEAGRPGARVSALRARHRFEPGALRALVLREGYLFATDPLDALALVTALKLTDLFDDESIWLERGAEKRRLVRDARRREIVYRYADGPLADRAADLLFGDRVSTREEELAIPLHRDLRGLADAIGFDRARLVHRSVAALVADLRIGDQWARAILDANGAALELGCWAEPSTVRDALRASQDADAPRRRAIAAIHEAVETQVAEGLRFDRPEGETSPDRDGELRPSWMTAYRQGRGSFQVDGLSLPVFDASGKPSPPQVCVDFVLDTYERAAGTWFQSRDNPPERVHGAVDFDDVRMAKLRSVIGFGDFAETRLDLFDVRRFADAERIAFRERSHFFGYLAEHADLRPGDVVSIRGLKRDERVHQHAILVEWTDPLTGFPYGLADQMKRPRRRTWEGIMAEAPARSLLYRVRPQPALLDRLDRGTDAGSR